MKTKFLSLALALALALSLSIPASAAESTEIPKMTCNIQWENYSAETAEDFQRQVYDALIALKSTYPDGTTWTNENRSYSRVSGNTIYNGGGCAAFAFMLCDAAFGTLPFRQQSSFAYDDIRPGDILRINNNTHSVVVLEKKADHLIIAEGNINSAVMWGRSLPKETAMAGILTTCYPELKAEPAPAPTPTPAPTPAPAPEPMAAPASGFADVADSSPYAGAVRWAVEQKITKGKTDTAFGPDDTCTVSHILTFLYRAAGSPDVSSDERASVIAWANGLGMDTGNLYAPCTRAMAVAYLWTAAGCPAAAGGVSFADVPAGADVFPAVSWAVGEGVTKGVTAEAFAPNRTCTRGQIVTFLYRAGM